MKYELLVSRTGPNINQSRGDIVELGKAEARRMMESEPPQCKPVGKKIKAEKAVK
ncbi:MAG: hypothetical protein L3J33_03485 [Rhodobacteraceae bacterium]|nr:hypothetical protein [Paracoccaceae bacterium]